jgi:transcription termination factor Rho
MTSKASESLPFGAAIPRSASKTTKKKVVKKPAAKKKAAKKPAAKKAVSKKPATKKAAAKKSASKKPASKKAASKKATTKKATTKKATTKKATTKKATTKKAATKKPASKKPASKKAASKKPTTKKAATKKPATKKAAKKPAVKKAATKKPAAKTAPVKKSKLKQSEFPQLEREQPERERQRPERQRSERERPLAESSLSRSSYAPAHASGDSKPVADQESTKDDSRESRTQDGEYNPQENEGFGKPKVRRRRRSRGRRRNRNKGLEDDQRQGRPDVDAAKAQAPEVPEQEEVVAFGNRASRVEEPQPREKSAGRGDSEHRRRRREERKQSNEGAGTHSREERKRSGEGAGTHSREDRKQSDEGVGILFQDRGGISSLRPLDSYGQPSKKDIFVPKHIVQKEKLRDGMVVRAKLTRGQKHQFQVAEVLEVDGRSPKSWRNQKTFRDLTSVDPDFHYAMGDGLGDTSMRIVDLLSPVGRGQRGLIVAPPRSGKTTIMRTFARGIEEIYSDVHLFVLLVDERPEEATEWSRAVKTGQVFASTSDEPPKHHIQLAEAVWKRCCRLVEMGEDVVLLIDSLTRLSRAYNNQLGAGRTMSGGLDTRAMEYPRKLFGSARNTENAGSLTILGTILVDTGSKMDQLVFEEFKGTGNMELVLNRRLADRRIFPAIDIEKTGTRKEEKLLGLRRLTQVNTLRRVMTRLHFAEAMEMLITRLDEVEKTDEFLGRFSTDPEA